MELPAYGAPYFVDARPVSFRTVDIVKGISIRKSAGDEEEVFVVEMDCEVTWPMIGEGI